MQFEPFPRHLNLIRSSFYIPTTTPQTFQIKRIQLCAAVRPPCVTLLCCSADGQTAATRRRKRRKDVRYHVAVGVFEFVLIVGDRWHGADWGSDPAGRPGAGPGQSERHVPRGGGVDGGHPAHTGGGCGPGLRHILFIHTRAEL